MPVLQEDLLTFHDVARQYNVHLSTCHRWRLRGVNGIRLETVRMGGKRVTSRQAVERFFAATTASVDGESTAPASAPHDRSAAIARAERELEQAGI